MSSVYDKPFKSFEEQIALMQSRGIAVKKDSRTIEILSSISYYSLVNGYKNTFLKSPNVDIFIEGTTFEMIYYIYLLDSAIAGVLLKYILIIERSLKTKIAYHVSKSYGVHHDDYLDPRNYTTRSKTKTTQLLNALEKKCNSPYRNTTSYHYRHNKNHVPPWILVNDITFNQIISWYKAMNASDKDYVCQNMIPYSASPITIDNKKEFFIKAVTLLLDYRNSIAHGNKVFSPHIKSILPKDPLFLLINDEAVLSDNEFNKGLGQKDLYAVFASLILLTNNVDLLRSLFLDLTHVFRDYYDEMILNKTYFELLGLPDDIMDRLQKFSISKASFLKVESIDKNL
ncbi:Abi family protein [Tindallia californiensis]|uniref:Abi family protein n=1 Tax=Tindallia californiensis TaxID=159292 RepID=UPI0015A1B71B|nr:Abi family protein [Tindallia californiensis]